MSTHAKGVLREKGRQVSYYLPTWLVDEVATIARETERSASYVVRNLAAEALAARAKKAGKK